MAQNVTIAGRSYSAVPSVQMPKTGGGIATFYDVEGSQTFTENGTFDVTTLAQAVINVAGGGGGGLEYETGTWTPSADIARGEISFTKTHTEAPVLVFLADATGTGYSATNSNMMFCFCDPYKLWGVGFPYTSSGFRYAVAYFSYRGSSTSALSSSALLCPQDSSSTSASSASYPRYWASPTGFHPSSNSTSRYWRSGRTYKWIAVWKP